MQDPPSGCTSQTSYDYGDRVYYFRSSMCFPLPSLLVIIILFHGRLILTSIREVANWNSSSNGKYRAIHGKWSRYIPYSTQSFTGERKIRDDNYEYYPSDVEFMRKITS